MLKSPDALLSRKEVKSERLKWSLTCAHRITDEMPEGLPPKVLAASHLTLDGISRAASLSRKFTMLGIPDLVHRVVDRTLTEHDLDPTDTQVLEGRRLGHSALEAAAQEAGTTHEGAFLDPAEVAHQIAPTVLIRFGYDRASHN